MGLIPSGLNMCRNGTLCVLGANFNAPSNPSPLTLQNLRLSGQRRLEVRGHGARPPLLVDLHVGGLRRHGRNHLASAEPLRRPDSDRPRNLGHRHRNAPQSSEERVQDSKYEHLLALRRCCSAEKDVCFLWIFPQRTMQSEPDCFCNRNILRKVKKEETRSKEKSSRILKATGNKFWRLCLVLIFAWYEKSFL